MIGFQHLQPQPDRVRGRGNGGDEPHQCLTALHHGAHYQGLDAIEIETTLSVAGGVIRPFAPGIAMRFVGPAGGDPGADGVAGPEIDDAGGVGIIAHRLPRAAGNGGGAARDLAVGTAAGGCPGRGAAVLCGGIAAQGVPGGADASEHQAVPREKQARVRLGRRVAGFSLA